MQYLTVKETAENWDLGIAMVSRYCSDNRIPGVKKENGKWLIPEDAKKPEDKRLKEPKFTFIDLFCGVGGFHQALSSLGGKCVFACDINELCRKVYAANYQKGNDDLIIGSDIKKAIKEKAIPNFKVLCGGFPCQTFSKAGKRNGFEVVEKVDGGEDDRGQLFFRIIDILKEHPECEYVILENVRNLADNETNWNVVCEELKTQGFVITETPIIESPHNFGIPQVRERVYILGIKETSIRDKKLLEEGKITREMLDVDRYYKKCPQNCIANRLFVVKY